MMSKPIALMVFQVGSDFVAVHQLAALGGRIAFFDLGAGFGQPFFMFLKQFQRPLDHFFCIVVRAGAQDFSNQPFLFRPQGDRHIGILRLPAYRGLPAGVKAISVGLRMARGGA
jgi:hypothetical protein